MAALNIKDFPDELKKKLKEEAKDQNRSFSAQLIWLLKERYGLAPSQNQTQQEQAT